MKQEQLKQVLISILVGACVAFFSTLFEELAKFFQTHSTELISGGATAFYHLSKTFKS